MSRNKLLVQIEYDGSFSGFQLQPNTQTIQGLIEDKLKIFFRIKDRIPITVCSRTDAGVRASANLITFTPPAEMPCLEKFCVALSNLCKPFVSFIKAVQVTSDFKFSNTVLAKFYRYYFFVRKTPPTFQRRFYWHLPDLPDLEKLNKQAKYFLGTHDFSAFRGRYCTSSNLIKTIFLSRFLRLGEYHYVYEIIGSGFLHKMVRNIVGTLIHYSKKGLSLDYWMNNSELKKFCAPPHGLCLEGIKLKSGEIFGQFPKEKDILSRGGTFMNQALL